jgi:signal transduction histidine kinase
MFSKLREVILAKEQEDGVRQFYLPMDINRARIGILLFTIPVAAFVFNDYQFFSLSLEFYSLALLRIILLMGSVYAWIYLGRTRNYRAYDRTILLSAFTLMIGGGIINATRPQNFIVQVIVTCISVFIIYLVIPGRLSYQCLIASIVTIGESLILIFALQLSNMPTLFTLGLSLFFANITAFLSSLQIHMYRQKSFQDFVKGKELQEKLELHTKHLEELVVERTEKLKAAERLAAIGATAGMVGHDIRNPLTAITGAVYLAQNDLKKLPDGETKENLKSTIELIGAQTFYVNKIVDDLQDYARPINPRVEETDLEEIVQSVLSTLKSPQEITVDFAIEKNYPRLKTDPAYIRRILTNLSNNALQAMPNGGKLIIRATYENNKAKIIVEDTGEGIAQEAKNKLFTPLFTTKSKGQGFGLAVVKKLTESLYGTVTYQSEIGKGTKFIVELPLLTNIK